MFFDTKRGELNGIVRCFREHGFPKLIVKGSKETAKSYNLSNIFNYETDDPQIHFVSAVDNPFIEIIFLKHKLFLTNYSLQSHKASKWYMQTWKFSGSINGSKWIPLHSVYKENYLINGNIEIFPSNETRIGFTRFKVEMTGETPYPDKKMRIMHIDLFGNLVSLDSQKQKACKLFSLLIFLLIHLLCS